MSKAPARGYPRRRVSFDSRYRSASDRGRRFRAEPRLRLGTTSCGIFHAQNIAAVILLLSSARTTPLAPTTTALGLLLTLVPFTHAMAPERRHFPNIFWDSDYCPDPRYQEYLVLIDYAEYPKYTYAEFLAEHYPPIGPIHNPPPQYSWTPPLAVAAFTPTFPHPLPTPDAPARATSSSSCNAGPSSEGQSSRSAPPPSESQMRKRGRSHDHRDRVAHYHRQQDSQEQEDTRHQRQQAEQRQLMEQREAQEREQRWSERSGSVPQLPPDLWAHVHQQSLDEEAQLAEWSAWADATLLQLVVTWFRTGGHRKPQWLGSLVGRNGGISTSSTDNIAARFRPWCNSIINPGQRNTPLHYQAGSAAAPAEFVAIYDLMLVMMQYLGFQCGHHDDCRESSGFWQTASRPPATHPGTSPAHPTATTTSPTGATTRRHQGRSRDRRRGRTPRPTHRHEAQGEDRLRAPPSVQTPRENRYI